MFVNIFMLLLVKGFKWIRVSMFIWLVLLLLLLFLLFNLGVIFVVIVILFNLGWLVLGFIMFRKEFN